MSDILKDLIIEEGSPAIYKKGSIEIPIKLKNVVKDSTGIYFNAINSTGSYIRNENGYIFKWSAKHAIGSGTIRIIKPKYSENDNKNTTVKIDPFLVQRAVASVFYKNHVKFKNEPFLLDDEQLNAVLSDTNTIITARAGSGKTRVLIAKLIYLFEKQGLKENNVLTFCFNRDASLEISDRLNNQCKIDNELKYSNFDIAKTFHSFSNKSTSKQYKILEDKKRLIKLIINEIRRYDYDFSKQMYQFFRDETLKIDRKKFKNNEAYYRYIRNCEYTTLNGEKVKSRYEKYIADYLFEHDIKYIYERSFYPYKINLYNSNLSRYEINEYEKFLENKKETKPDFYLPDYKSVWEHWALTGKETLKEKLHFENEIGNYDDYITNKKWKQKFWDKNWRNKLKYDNKYNNDIKFIEKFIESDYTDITGDTREEIDNSIEIFLKNKYGIYSEKLPENIIIQRTWEKAIDGFTGLMEQFINKYQQIYFDCEDLFTKKLGSIEDKRISTYYKLGFRVYKKYLDILNSLNNEKPFEDYNQYNIDFNQLIYECSKSILNGELDNQLKDIKWILIDEYQDFSRLFNYLISAILKRNPNIKLFCVGDDWQAINRFAGSDLKYFNAFTTRYQNSTKLDIKTNYRSEMHIVEFANSFASKQKFTGEKQVAKISSSGESKEIDILDVYIGKFDDKNKFLNCLDYYNNEENTQYMKINSDIIEKAKYLKICSDIIEKFKDKKILILNRKNILFDMELKTFYNLLKNVCADFISSEKFEKNIQVKTVHKSKGEEADVVILLDINEGSFPIYNPNNDLFEIFGQKPFESVEDEEKLYYVALTRAKQNLYIIYNSSKPSAYILENYKSKIYKLKIFKNDYHFNNQ